MPRAPGDYLNPREQQIMEAAFRRGRVTAADLEELLPGRPSNSTVRTLLRILESRGHLTHVEEEGRFVYLPVLPRANAARSAWTASCTPSLRTRWNRPSPPCSPPASPA